MARRAGTYGTRLIWLKHTPVADDATGQVKDTYPANGFLWASVVDQSATKAPSNGLLTAQSTTEIRINGFPTVGFKDQLQEKGESAVYAIDGIHRGDAELILSCTRKQVR